MICFKEESNRIGRHPFLKSTNVPTRRYSIEQLAAQILAQVFSFETARERKNKENSHALDTLSFRRLFKTHTTNLSDERKRVDRENKASD